MTSAKAWLASHAKFNVPQYLPPSASASSASVNSDNVNRLGTEVPLPAFAFEDAQKVPRLISILERGLGNNPLRISPDNTTSDGAQEVYANLFSPRVEHKDGVWYDEWTRFSSKADCVLLIKIGLMFAIKSITWRLFDEKIITFSEPLHPLHNIGSALEHSRERVDMVVRDSLGTNLYLIEAKAPIVFEDFAEWLGEERFRLINLSSNPSTAAKAIYYMHLWKINFLVLSCFSFCIILEIHEDAGNCYLSYSQPVAQHDNTEIVRALLGLTLGTLRNEAALSRPEARRLLDEAWRSATASAGPGLPLSGGRSRRAGTGTSPIAGGSRGSGLGQKRSDGIGQDNSRILLRGERSVKSDACTNGTSKQDFLQSGGFATSDICTIDSDPRLTRSLARKCEDTGSQETQGSKGTATTKRIDCPGLIISDRLSSSEFELIKGVRFPSFPTSDETPHLEVVEALGTGLTGTVGRATLRHHNGCGEASYAIKSIDASWRLKRGYSNCCKELLNEYITYCLLELGKHVEGLENVMKCIPTCYGLYQRKDPSLMQFVLVTEYVGRPVDSFKKLSDEDKSVILESIICLHSIGLCHGDAEERNIVYDRERRTVKFIDFCNSTWHDCPGAAVCDETRAVRRMTFGPDGNKPLAVLEEDVINRYNLEFCNLRELLVESGQIEPDELAKELKEQADIIEREYVISV